MIIVEGPDGAGKSTLVNSLADRLRYIVHRNSGPPKDVEALHERINKYRSLPHWTICDRHAGLSELIYGPIIRGTRIAFNPSAILPGKVLIYCRPPLETLMASHVIKESDPPDHAQKVTERIKAIVEAYDAAMPAWSLLVDKFYTYDFTQGEFKL